MDSHQLQAYRQLGLSQLRQLMLELSEEIKETDFFIDQTIRALSELPSRPEEAPPYIGLYGQDLDKRTYREKAIARLEELVTQLAELRDIDEEVDKHIRVLSNLPERPNDALPYTRLFTLSSTQTAAAPPSAGFDVASAPQLVTAEQLLKIAGTHELEDRIRAFTPGVNATFAKFQINTPLRMAHFLAQVMHESGGFRYLREIWGPTDWQIAYEGREDLGNTQPGDGERFMGRGLIQLTGRANYAEFSDAVGMDFVSHPELVEQPPYAVLVAGWYWDSRNINGPADRDDLEEVTYRINGGTLGLEDRAAYLDQAKAVLL